MHDGEIRELVRQVIDVQSPEESFLVSEFDITKIKKESTPTGPLHAGIDLTDGLLIAIVWLIFSELIKETMKEVAKGWCAYVVKLWRQSRAGSATPADRASALNAIKGKLIEEGIADQRAAEIASTILDTYLNRP